MPVTPTTLALTDTDTPGMTVYVIIQNTAETATWAGAGPGLLTDSDAARIVGGMLLSESPPASGNYGPAATPTTLPPGAYTATYWQRVGATPATTDPLLGRDAVTATAAPPAPDTSAARILEVRDAVAARLASLTPGLDVRREYVPDVDDAGVTAPPTARTVYVMPARYGQDEDATRTADLFGYAVAVVVVAPVALPAARSEVDGQIGWCQRAVYEPLRNPRLAPVLPAPCEAVWPTAAEVVQVYDPDELRRGLFLCEMQFTFSEIG